MYGIPYGSLPYDQPEIITSGATTAPLAGGAAVAQLFAPRLGPRPMRLPTLGLLAPNLAFPASIASAAPVAANFGSTLPMMGCG